MSARETATCIEIEVEEPAASDAALAAKLEEVCPVDIYRDAGGRAQVGRENLDEGVLCELCLDASPPGAVVVKKLYDRNELRR